MTLGRGGNGKVIERHAVRAVLLTTDRQVLLIRVREPRTEFLLWLTPGGGLSPGEEPEQCLRRELREETGLTGIDVGPHLWTRFHDFTWDGQRIRQREDYYLVPVAFFQPTMHGNPEEGERSAFAGFRWWTPAEIESSADVFVPRRLADHLNLLLREGPPLRPIHVGQ
ncbi:NUDIX hydrolase [Planctomycetota bacterium]